METIISKDRHDELMDFLDNKEEEPRPPAKGKLIIGDREVEITGCYADELNFHFDPETGKTTRVVGSIVTDRIEELTATLVHADQEALGACIEQMEDAEIISETASPAPPSELHSRESPHE